jgi:DNA-binding SARP family transcriptional activator
MPSGTVQNLSDPGATLAVPADGRINGYHFAARVLGVAAGRRDANAQLIAGPRQQLWVFGLAWTSDVITASGGVDQSVLPVTATLIYQGNRLPVPVIEPQPPAGTAVGADTTKAQTGDQFFAASLPAGAGDVEVEMASDGFAQDFSLSHLTREGLQPAALYRDPGGWETTVNLAAVKSLPTPYLDPADGYNLPDAALQIQLPTVTLSYFGPDGTSDPAPTPGQAWLIPALADPFNPTGSNPSSLLEYRTPTTAVELTLTPADGAPIHPKALPGGPDAGDAGQCCQNDLFTNSYVFAVPSTLDSATLTIDTPPESVTPAASGVPQRNINPGPAVFPIPLPAPTSFMPPADASATPARLPGTTTSSNNAPKASNHTVSAALAALAGGVVLAALITAIVLRLRRRRPVSPAGGPSAGRSSQTTAGPYADLVDASNGTASPAVTPPPLAGSTSRPAPETLSPFEPPQPPELAGLAVSVLGPITVTGWTEKPNRAAVTQIVGYLAAHLDRPVNLDKLQWALGVDRDIDPSPATMRTYLSQARRCLGGGRLPESVAGGGYQLRDTNTDWATFQTLVTAAEAAETAGDTGAAIDNYGQALALVRGTPYDSDSGYGWVDLEDHRTTIETAIARSAQSLSRIALEQQQAQLGLWAAHQGLLANPLDETLHLAALDAAAASAQPGAVRAEWARIQGQLQSRQTQPGTQLAARYEHFGASGHLRVSATSRGFCEVPGIWKLRLAGHVIHAAAEDLAQGALQHRLAEIGRLD